MTPRSCPGELVSLSRTSRQGDAAAVLAGGNGREPLQATDHSALQLARGGSCRRESPELAYEVVADAALIVGQLLDRVDDRTRALAQLIGIERRRTTKSAVALRHPVVGSVGSALTSGPARRCVRCSQTDVRRLIVVMSAPISYGLSNIETFPRDKYDASRFSLPCPVEKMTGRSGYEAEICS